jgi:hypothetical protein
VFVIAEPGAYRLAYRPEDVSVVGTVVFAMDDPADEHEACLSLRLSAAAWLSQGAPRELILHLTAPAPEEQP